MHLNPLKTLKPGHQFLSQTLDTGRNMCHAQCIGILSGPTQSNLAGEIAFKAFEPAGALLYRKAFCSVPRGRL